MTDPDTSTDFCYRHPKRASWVLCQRCGRTICPECQILAPVGVQCPECVKEAGGSVNWQRVGGKPAAAARSTRSSRPTRSSASSPRWMQAVGQMLRPGSSTPILTWWIVAISVVLWIAGLFTPVPFTWGAAVPSLELWRFFTAVFVYPPGLGSILSLLLNVLFFLLNAPSVERSIGRGRFLTLFFASSAFAMTAMTLVSGFGYGLIGALFGFFGFYLVQVWSYPPARVQMLIMIGINFVLSISFGRGFFLPALVGGLVMGVGAAYLFLRYDARTRSNPRTPHLVIWAVVVGFIALTLIRVYV